MKLEIVNQKKNPLMSREEYAITIDHGGKATPSRHDILKEVAREVKSREDVIIIDRIISRSGASVSDATVFVYRKKDEIPKGKLEKMERRMTKKKKEGPAPAPAPAAEAPKEEPQAEEATKEEPAEEPKEEVKKETSEEEPEAEEEPKEEATKEEPQKEENEEKKG